MNIIENAMRRLEKDKHIPSEKDMAKPLWLAADKINIKMSPAAEGKPVFQLDWEKLTGAGYLTPYTKQGTLAEEFRLIKRPVLLNASRENNAQSNKGNLIAITSPLPGEGKTFTTINLAMSIIMERDSTVLLIDGDLIKRSLTSLLGLDKAKGLTDVLLDSHLELHDVIVDTNFPKLRLIPAGQPSGETAELLTSKRMQAIASELSTPADHIVLFDTPPILTTIQSRILTTLVGQILVVVAEGNTSQDEIRDAIAVLPDEEDKVIGMILNKCRRSSGSKYYGYYSSAN